MRHGKVIAQVEIQQMNHRLKGFSCNQANRKPMHLFADLASPWREWGMYLAFRARLREAQISTPA